MGRCNYNEESEHLLWAFERMIDLCGSRFFSFGHLLKKKSSCHMSVLCVYSIR